MLHISGLPEQVAQSSSAASTHRTGESRTGVQLLGARQRSMLISTSVRQGGVRISSPSKMPSFPGLKCTHGGLGMYPVMVPPFTQRHCTRVALALRRRRKVVLRRELCQERAADASRPASARWNTNARAGMQLHDCSIEAIVGSAGRLLLTWSPPYVRDTPAIYLSEYLGQIE